MTGKNYRVNKFFRENNRSLIVAIDHGLMVGSINGISNICEIIEKLINTPIDGLLASPIGIKTIRQEFPNHPFPLIYTIDYAMLSNLSNKNGKEFIAHTLLWDIDDAVKNGADAVKMFLNFGDYVDPFMDNVKAVNKVVKQSENWGVPVMVEVLFMDNNGFSDVNKQKKL